MPSRRASGFLGALPFSGSLAVVLWAALACGGGEVAPETTALDRETFIRSWVDLRVAAVRSGEPLTDSLRSVVLDRQGVTEEELMEFAEVRGDDLAYMRDLWSEVEARLQNEQVPAEDSVRLY